MRPAEFEVVAQQDLKVTLPAVLDTSGLKRTPLLEPFRQDIQVQQARIKVDKADLLPTFGGQYGWQKIGSQSGFNSWKVGINIPLWFGPQKTEIQAASIQTDIAERRSQEVRIDLQSHYRQLVQEFGKNSKT